MTQCMLYAGSYGWTPLHLAVKYNRHEMVALLVNAKVGRQLLFDSSMY